MGKKPEKGITLPIYNALGHRHYLQMRATESDMYNSERPAQSHYYLHNTEHLPDTYASFSEPAYNSPKVWRFLVELLTFNDQQKGHLDQAK